MEIMADVHSVVPPQSTTTNQELTQKSERKLRDLQMKGTHKHTEA